MPDAIDCGRRVAWRSTADKREVRVVVVLADRAFDEPAEWSTVVLYIGEPLGLGSGGEIHHTCPTESDIEKILLGCGGRIEGLLTQEGMRAEIVGVAYGGDEKEASGQ